MSVSSAPYKKWSCPRCSPHNLETGSTRKVVHARPSRGQHIDPFTNISKASCCGSILWYFAYFHAVISTEYTRGGWYSALQRERLSHKIEIHAINDDIQRFSRLPIHAVMGQCRMVVVYCG